MLSAGEHIEHARIANLSHGGLLAITAGPAPEALRDADVAIELRLDAASAAWLRLTGRVVRLDSRAVAVALEAAPEPFARLMEESASASDEHEAVRTVVLVDATAERRRTIADAFRAAWCAVLEVSTPLEAIVRLGESAFEPDLIAIADSEPSATADELRRFVEREHPCAKMVTIGDDLLGPPGQARWLSSADPEDDLIARVRDLLYH